VLRDNSIHADKHRVHFLNFFILGGPVEPGMDSLQKVDSLLSYYYSESVVKRKKKDKCVVLFDIST
jgi:hypothetical protein